MGQGRRRLRNSRQGVGGTGAGHRQLQSDGSQHPLAELIQEALGHAGRITAGVAFSGGGQPGGGIGQRSRHRGRRWQNRHGHAIPLLQQPRRHACRHLGLQASQQGHEGQGHRFAVVGRLADVVAEGQPQGRQLVIQAGRAIKSLSNGFPTQTISSSPAAASASRLGSNAPCPLAAMHSSGFTLATVLIFGSGLFVLATLFFGTKGGYYNTDSYDGNGTAH